MAPLTIVGDTTLIGISTLTSEINFYTRLIRLKDKATGYPLFTILQVELACAKCKDDGKAIECVHLLHLVPRWQSSERHRRLKTIMQDRPDLIESELSGLAFDSLQQCYRPADIEHMFKQEPPPPELHQEIFICVDPAGGGPQSDFSFISFQRVKGQVILVGMDSISTKEPSRQYALLENHIHELRKNLYRSSSRVTVYVERNLGFEAEHAKRALSHLAPSVSFYEDLKAGRVGVLTTDNVKYASMELLNIHLREKRVSLCKYCHSRDLKGMKLKLRDQLEIFSWQFKQALNTFQKDRSALSGKVGGMKDDLCIALMLGVYFTSVGILEKDLQRLA